jgi:hypothetical protein
VFSCRKNILFLPASDTQAKEDAAHRCRRLFPRVEPLNDLHPMYSEKLSSPIHADCLPIRQFEQLLDQQDLHSIQL